ncbi:MAG: hypothetical protein H2045_09170 [Rhizobiales bacterium]|nr:hypothetical protein [Hyphomicrobiales bacterium]
MSNKLPPVLAEMADFIGLKATLELVEAKGGQRIHIPLVKTITPEHWLAQLIGIEAAHSLSRAYCHQGGVPLDIPIFTNNYLKYRNREYQRLESLGYSANEIATMMQITRRSVFKRRRKTRNGEPAIGHNSNQHDLFFSKKQSR